MKAFPHNLARAGVVALCIGAPALAAAPPDTATGPDSPGLEITRHAMPPPDVTAKPPETPAVSANPLWAIPLSALSATRNRPLFTPTRRPPAPIIANAPAPVAARPPPPAPTVPEHPNFVLVGTVAGESDSVAVFIDNATRDAVRLRAGEGHSGWVLQSIDRRTATLQKGNQTETLELPKPGATAQGPAPVISPLPPPPAPPPQAAAPAAPAAGGNQPPQRQGCMPAPIGC